MSAIETIPAEASRQDDLYQDAAKNYGAALERLARAYEADPEMRSDLLQDIHVGLASKDLTAGARSAHGFVVSLTMLALRYPATAPHQIASAGRTGRVGEPA